MTVMSCHTEKIFSQRPIQIRFNTDCYQISFLPSASPSTATFWRPLDNILFLFGINKVFFHWIELNLTLEKERLQYITKTQQLIWCMIIVFSPLKALYLALVFLKFFSLIHSLFEWKHKSINQSIKPVQIENAALVHWHTNTHTYKSSHASSHTYAAVTAFESLTAKHRWDLERDIVVASQESDRMEAKLTVQPHCRLNFCFVLTRRTAGGWLQLTHSLVS